MARLHSINTLVKANPLDPIGLGCKIEIPVSTCRLMIMQILSSKSSLTSLLFDLTTILDPVESCGAIANGLDDGHVAVINVA